GTREQFDGPPEMAKRGVSGVAREGCEARVVVIEARVVRHVLEGSADRVERYAVYLEGRLAVEHDVQLLLARPGLVVLVDQRRVLAGRVGVDSECVDPEVLAHRNISAAPLGVVEACDLPRRVVVHPYSPPSCAGRC